MSVRDGYPRAGNKETRESSGALVLVGHVALFDAAIFFAPGGAERVQSSHRNGTLGPVALPRATRCDKPALAEPAAGQDTRCERRNAGRPTRHACGTVSHGRVLLTTLSSAGSVLPGGKAEGPHHRALTRLKAAGQWHGESVPPAHTTAISDSC